jgi:hypothetical protein
MVGFSFCQISASGAENRTGGAVLPADSRLPELTLGGGFPAEPSFHKSSQVFISSQHSGQNLPVRKGRLPPAGRAYI